MGIIYDVFKYLVRAGEVRLYRLRMTLWGRRSDSVEYLRCFQVYRHEPVKRGYIFCLRHCGGDVLTALNIYDVFEYIDTSRRSKEILLPSTLLGRRSEPVIKEELDAVSSRPLGAHSIRFQSE